MINIFVALIMAIITVAVFYYCVKLYKESDTQYEKVLYILFTAVWCVPIIIYYIDRYNIPSLIGYTSNMEINRWFEFITNYTSTIVGTIISGVIVLLITIKQIKIQIDNNNEDRRIQNAPILKYNVTNHPNYKCSTYYISNGPGEMYSLFINIENVGLNHAKNIKFKVNYDNELSRDYKIDYQQAILKKDTDIWIEIVINFKILKKMKSHKMDIIFYYNDLLYNNYMQEMNLTITPTKHKNSFDKEYNSLLLKIDNIVIKNEVFLSENPNRKSYI